MSEQKRIPYFRDKRADTLTREELLVAYTLACEALDDMRRWNQVDRDMDAMFRDAINSLAESRA